MQRKYVDLLEITNEQYKRVVLIDNYGEITFHGEGWSTLKRFETNLLRAFLDRQEPREYVDLVQTNVYQRNIHIWPASSAKARLFPYSTNEHSYFQQNAGRLCSYCGPRAVPHGGGFTPDLLFYVWVPNTVIQIAEYEWFMDRALKESGQEDLPHYSQDVWAILKKWNEYIQADIGADGPSALFQEKQQFVSDISHWLKLAGDTPLPEYIDPMDARRLHLR